MSGSSQRFVNLYKFRYDLLKGRNNENFGIRTYSFVSLGMDSAFIRVVNSAALSGLRSSDEVLK